MAVKEKIRIRLQSYDAQLDVYKRQPLARAERKAI